MAALTAAAAAAAVTEPPDEPILLIAKFRGEEIELPLMTSTQIIQIKAVLQERTNVLMHRQKLVGLNQGSRPAADEARLNQVTKLKNPHKFILMGTPEADIFVDPSDFADRPEVFDDFDMDVTHNSDDWRRAIENSENLAAFTAKTEVHFIHPPRPGKRLLVLDLDHTLLDFSGRASSSAANVASLPAELAALKRPHMDAFLTLVYREYDLAVWSQTSWRWLELKLTELGLLHHPEYRICFVLDKTSMFHVTSRTSDGKDRKHQVKPLQLIWKKFSHWTEKNTLHIDDLGRNFALNPNSGIKIKPYHRKHHQAAADCELQLLARYLLQLAAKEDSFARDHSDWRRHDGL